MKKGDTLQLNSDRSVGQATYFNEDERVVELVKSTNTVETNPYEGPGNVSDVTLKDLLTGVVKQKTSLSIKSVLVKIENYMNQSLTQVHILLSLLE